MLPQWCKDQMQTSASLDAIANYIVVIFDDGDYLNDFLADVPECGASIIQTVGYLLASVLF